MERKLSKKNIVGIAFTGATSLLILVFAGFLFLFGRPLQGSAGKVAVTLMAYLLAVPVIVLSIVSISLCANCKAFKLLPLASLGVLLLSIGAGVGGYRYLYVQEERDIEMFADYTSVVSDINYSVCPQVTYTGAYNETYIDVDHSFYNAVKDITVEVTPTRPFFLSTWQKVEYTSLDGCAVTYYESGYLEAQREHKGITYKQRYMLRDISFEAIYNAAIKGE